MSKSAIVRGAKLVGVFSSALLIAASAGSAAAAPTPASGPTTVTAENAPSTSSAVAQSTSWREGAVATGTTANVATVVTKRPSRAVSARQALAAQQAKFTKFTLASAATKDMRGVEKSLYRGKYFNATSEAKRLCVVKRESEGHYDVVNPSGSYFGAYQVSRSLARGATWMMLKEHKKLMGDKAAKQTLAKLRSKPMNTWPRYWQDAAFHTVINWDHTLSGASHWAGGRWHC